MTAPGSSASERRFTWKRKSGAWAKDSSMLLSWMLARAVAQALGVVLLARALGAREYGHLVAVLAIAALVAPAVGLGLSHMVLRNGSMDPKHVEDYLRIARRWWVISLLPGVSASLVLAQATLPAEALTIWAVVAITTEIIVNSFAELCARRQQALHNISGFGAINAGLAIFRLATLGLAWFWVPKLDSELALGLCAASGLGYFFCLLIFCGQSPSECGKPMQQMSAASGLPFALSTLSVRIQADFNKPVLAQVDFGLTGALNGAQRFVDLAALPLSAVLESLWPKLYSQTFVVKPLLWIATKLYMLAGATTLMIWLAAPWLPLLLGPDFASAIDILRWLCGLPLLLLTRSLTNFLLIRRRQFAPLAWAAIAGAATGVVLVLLLVPTRGVVGVLAAAYASETMAIALLAMCLMLSRANQD